MQAIVKATTGAMAGQVEINEGVSTEEVVAIEMVVDKGVAVKETTIIGTTTVEGVTTVAEEATVEVSNIAGATIAGGATLIAIAEQVPSGTNKKAEVVRALPGGGVDRPCSTWSPPSFPSLSLLFIYFFVWAAS